MLVEHAGQILIGCSLLGQKGCRLIGLILENSVKATLNITYPTFCKVIMKKNGCKLALNLIHILPPCLIVQGNCAFVPETDRMQQPVYLVDTTSSNRKLSPLKGREDNSKLQPET